MASNILFSNVKFSVFAEQFSGISPVK